MRLTLRFYIVTKTNKYIRIYNIVGTSGQESYHYIQNDVLVIDITLKV